MLLSCWKLSIYNQIMLLLYGKPHFTPDSLPRPNKVSAYLSDLVSYCACHSSLVSFCSFLPKALTLAFPLMWKFSAQITVWLAFSHHLDSVSNCWFLREVFPLIIPSTAFSAATVTLFILFCSIVLYIIFTCLLPCLCHWKTSPQKTRILALLFTARPRTVPVHSCSSRSISWMNDSDMISTPN